MSNAESIFGIQHLKINKHNNKNNDNSSSSSSSSNTSLGINLNLKKISEKKREVILHICLQIPAALRLVKQ